MSGRSSRRAFLQTSGGAAAVLAAREVLLGSRAEASPAPTSAGDRVRFGMIGVGMQGSGLLSTSIALPGVECAAACDLYDGRHTLAREIAGPALRTTRRYQELLDDAEIDCIVAAVPDHWHRKIVVDSVKAGKDVYCEKPMSHTAADGLEMVAAARGSGRVVQIGSQRVSSVLCARARELVARGLLGDITLVEGSLGRNDPTGAWVYPPPPDLTPATLDWDTWQGDVPKRRFDPIVFARWRCFRDYGTGLAGDLMVHLVSGMLHVWGRNEAPRRAVATGGILRWRDGRDMPDVHSVLFEYGEVPVYIRLTLNAQTPEVLRFFGTRGILELTERSVTFSPQLGADTAPSYYSYGYPAALREAYVEQWHREHDPEPGDEPLLESVSCRGPSYDDVKPHLARFFDAVRTREPVVEDAVFGNHAALACHMANESYFRGRAVTFDAAAGAIVG